MTNSEMPAGSNAPIRSETHLMVSVERPLVESALRGFGNGLTFGLLDNALALRDTYLRRNGHSFKENRQTECQYTWQNAAAAEAGMTVGAAVALLGGLAAAPVAAASAVLFGGAAADVGINLLNEHASEGDKEH